MTPSIHTFWTFRHCFRQYTVNYVTKLRKRASRHLCDGIYKNLVMEPCPVWGQCLQAYFFQLFLRFSGNFSMLRQSEFVRHSFTDFANYCLVSRDICKVVMFVQSKGLKNKAWSTGAAGATIFFVRSALIAAVNESIVKEEKRFTALLYCFVQNGQNTHTL